MQFDERILKSTGAIKKSLFLLWFILSVISIFLKMIFIENLTIIIIQSIPESIFILGFLVSKAIEYKMIQSTERIDERVDTTIQMMYHKTFIYTVLLVILGYVIEITLLQADELISFNSLPNLFVNVVLIISFLVYFVKSKKSRIYLFNQFLDLSTKNYIKKILILILRLFGIGLLYLSIGLILHLILTESPVIEFISTGLAFLISLLSFSFWIILVSSYEWLDYQEGIYEEETKRVRLIPKKVITFQTWIYILVISYTLFMYIYRNNWFPSNTETQLVIITLVYLYFLFEMPLLIIPQIILLVIIYKSIKRIFPSKMNLHLAILVYGILAIISSLTSSILQIYFQLFPSSIVTTIPLSNKISMIMAMITLMISLIFIVALKRIGSKIWVWMLTSFFMVMTHLLLTPLVLNNAQDFLFYNQKISSVISIFLSTISYIVYIKLTNISYPDKIKSEYIEEAVPL